MATLSFSISQEAGSQDTLLSPGQADNCCVLLPQAGNIAGSLLCPLLDNRRK